MTIQNVTDADFEVEVLGQDGLVLVDFWAPWCGPCRTLSPILDRLAGEASEDFRIVKMNIDECPETVERFGVRSAPTLIIFKAAQPLDTRLGIMSKGQLSSWVADHLN